MKKMYGQFIGTLSTKEIKKNFSLNDNLTAFIFKCYILLLGYPDIGGAVRFPKVIKRLNPKPKEKILDIGCGRGFYSHYINAQGSIITGIDDGPFVEVAQNIGRALKLSTNVQRVNITKTPEHFNQASELFDKIIAIEVLEHLEQDRETFANWCKLLKKNGTMIFSVPLATEEEINNFKPDLINDPYGHKRAGYTMSQIKQLCMANNMDILEYESSAKEPTFNIINRNATYYNNKQFNKIMLSFPIWKIRSLLEGVSNNSTKGYHQIMLTLKKTA